MVPAVRCAAHRHPDIGYMELAAAEFHAHAIRATDELQTVSVLAIDPGFNLKRAALNLAECILLSGQIKRIAVFLGAQRLELRRRLLQQNVVFFHLAPECAEATGSTASRRSP